MLGELRTFQKRLLGWYATHRRDLPWRPAMGARNCLPDPYYVLISEAMLQQTQVATVIPYFERFIAAYPTVDALATADEQAVLRLWQGLGYYSRARNLQSAARAVVERFGGHVPSDVEQLLSLPGVGRYTAGAIASIAHDQPAPIVDGNVIRVLCRIDRIETDPRDDKQSMEQLWTRARAILPRKNCADFNSSLMELGATVCLTRGPRCLVCPVRAHCEAAEAGVQEQIPPPRKSKPTPLVHRWTFCIEHSGQYLIEQRPAKGRWAGMWQFVTLAAGQGTPTARTVRDAYGISAARPVHLGQVSHTLTHRRYTFDVYRVRAKERHDTASTHQRLWASLDELERYPLPRPHLRIVELLRGQAAT
jgi:A/G-specific adenine glycosylase